MALDKSPIQKVVFEEVPTVRAFAEFFMESYAKPRNKPSELIAKRQIIDGYIVPMFGDFRVNEIQAEHLDIFCARMKEAGAAPKTINNRLAVLHKLLKYAYECRHVKVVPPWLPLKVRTKEMRHLTKDECHRLVAAAREHGPYWHAMVVLALHTGLRNGEIRALRWEHVNLRKRELRVVQADYRGHVTAPKSVQSQRLLSINAEVVKALETLVPVGPFVFGKRRKLKEGESPIVAHETTRNRLRRICLEAGVRPCGWHTLRHTFASHLAMSGVPLRFIQDLLGHSTIQMTNRYAKLSPESKVTVTDVLVGVFGPPVKNEVIPRR